MTEIASAAEAAHAALTALKEAVKGLPGPEFKLDRSIRLLDRLASWARTSGGNAGFQDAEAIGNALGGGLASGCAGLKKPGQLRQKLQAPEGDAAEKPRPISFKDVCSIFGRAGGESESPKKVAAARANIAIINEKRWGKRRKGRSR